MIEKSFQIVNPFLFLQAMYYCISLWLVKDGLIYEDISKWKSVFKFANVPFFRCKYIISNE